jgi:hypothetical protein
MHNLSRATTATAALLFAATLTACGADGNPGSKATAAETDASAAPIASLDCFDPNLSQADWMKACSQGAGTGGDGKAAPTADLALGKPAETIGAEGAGVMEITPTTVVYATKGTGQDPDNDLFAVVTVKDRPTTAAPARETAPIDQGGWQWIAPDGQAIDQGNGTAFNVVPEPFSAGGPIQPGSFKWDSQIFDLTDAQRGGTLVYTDGEGTAYRWKIPTKDAGPQIADVKKALEF